LCKFCTQRASLHADNVSDLHSFCDALGPADMVGGDNDLVDPLPIVLRELVRLGTLGFLVGEAFLSTRVWSVSS
jgi:hypothetical protein